MNSLAELNTLLIYFLLGLFGLAILIVLLILIGYVLLIFYRNRHRERESLNSTLLQVAVPRDNEIKIDAAEQLFSSFASMRKSGRLGGRLGFLEFQPSLSFEIVGMPHDIGFYVNTPN
jgi:hypothetical protein